MKARHRFFCRLEGINTDPMPSALPPTSRKEREKWGTPLIYDATDVGHPPFTDDLQESPPTT